jgi:TonB family protein
MTGPTASQTDAGEIDPARSRTGGRAVPAVSVPLVPSLPLVPRARAGRWRRPAVVASVLAHLLALAALVLLLRTHPTPEAPGREQSVAMVFERTPTPSPAAPRPGVPELTKPGGLPQPTTPPVPDAPPIPEPPPPPSAASPPPTPTPSPPSAPQEEVNLQPPPAQAAPSLPDLPPVPIPAAPAPPPVPEDLAGTIPPVPPPAPPAKPAPQREAALSPPLLRPPPTHREPPARPRAARPATPRNEFAPMNFSLAPPSHAAPSSVARSFLQPPSPTDTEPGGGARTAAGMLETFARAREGDPGPDFMASLKSWWLAHRFYPPQAIEAGEDGDVQISLIVDRQGRVTEVRLETRSGSMWLDMAGQSTWRDAKLLPIPDSMGRDHLTIDLTLHYVLMRR